MHLYCTCVSSCSNGLLLIVCFARQCAGACFEFLAVELRLDEMTVCTAPALISEWGHEARRWVLTAAHGLHWYSLLVLLCFVLLNAGRLVVQKFFVGYCYKAFWSFGNLLPQCKEYRLYFGCQWAILHYVCVRHMKQYIIYIYVMNCKHLLMKQVLSPLGYTNNLVCLHIAQLERSFPLDWIFAGYLWMSLIVRVQQQLYSHGIADKCMSIRVQDYSLAAKFNNTGMYSQNFSSTCTSRPAAGFAFSCVALSSCTTLWVIICLIWHNFDSVLPVEQSMQGPGVVAHR